MIIVGGNFGSNHSGQIETTLGGKMKRVVILRGFTKRPINVKPEDIATAEPITDENKISVLGGLGWGVAGTLIAGPIGAVVGGLLGAKKQQHLMLVTLKNGKQFLANCGSNERGLLLAACLTSDVKPAKDARELIEKLPNPNEVDWESLGGKPAPKRVDPDGLDWSFLEE